MYTSSFNIESISKSSKALLSNAFLVGMLVFNSSANALTLGDFKVDSFLDKPLKAEISIDANSGDNLDTLIVSIASEEEFKQAGIDRIDSLQDIKFEVKRESDQKAKILVSTDKPVNDPYVQMLIKLSWNGGQILREFTALIDPPLYSSGPAPKVDTATTGQTQQSEITESEITSKEITSQSSEVSASASSSGSARFSGGIYGPVTAGQTLSEIAQEIQGQYGDLSIYQIMLSLHNDNPEAFINNNINGLLKGAVLDVADANQIRQIERQESINFFYSQVAEWNASKNQAGSAGDQASSQSSDSATQSSSNNDQAQSDSASGATGSSTSASSTSDSTKPEFQVASSSIESGGSSNGKIIEDLKAKIADLEASYESSRLENEELRDAISILENQLADSGRLIELNNQELASLQAKQKDEKPTQVEPLKGEVQTEGQAESASAAGAATGTAVPEPKPAAPTVVETEAKPEAAEPKPVVAPKPEPKPLPVKLEEKSLVDTAIGIVTDFWKEIAAALGVLGLLIGLLVMRERRKDSEEEFEASFTAYPEDFDDEDADVEAANSSFQQDSEMHDTSVVSSIDMDALREATQSGADFEVDSADVSDTTKESSFLTVYNDGDVIVNADEIDPIAEADVYIAYGREDQGEEVLLDGINSFPGRVDIKIALLNLYVKSKQREKFEDIYSQLEGTGLEKNIEDLQTVEELRKSMDLAVPGDKPIASLSGAESGEDADGIGEESSALDMAATQILSSPLVEDTVDKIVESKSVDVNPSSSQLGSDVKINSIIDELSEVDINEIDNSLDISEIDFANEEKIEQQSLEGIDLDLSLDEKVSPSVEALLVGDKNSEEVDFSNDLAIDGDELDIELGDLSDELGDSEDANVAGDIDIQDETLDVDDIEIDLSFDESESELEINQTEAPIDKPNETVDMKLDITGDLGIDISEEIEIEFEENADLTDQASDDVEIDISELSNDLSQSFKDANEIDKPSQIDFSDQSLTEQYSDEVEFTEEDSVESELSFDLTEENEDGQNEFDDIDLDLGVSDVDFPDGENDPETQLDLAKVFIELDDISGAVNILKDLTEDDVVGSEAKELLERYS